MITVGVDIVELSRIRRAVRRSGAGFLNRVMGPAERLAAHRRGLEDAVAVAACLTVKEAVIKALGGLPRGTSLQEICVLLDRSGVRLEFRGALARLMAQRGLQRAWAACDWQGDLALATVVLEFGGKGSGGGSDAEPGTGHAGDEGPGRGNELGCPSPGDLPD
nr:MAG: hypothetical protein DIU70_05590 [Bacillota bacterium]